MCPPVPGEAPFRPPTRRNLSRSRRAGLAHSLTYRRRYHRRRGHDAGAWAGDLPRPRIARNHALVDGNKRLALAAIIAFYGVNGVRLTFGNGAAYDFVIAVATGRLDDVAAIAAVLERDTDG
jgi:hypothetical protein